MKKDIRELIEKGAIYSRLIFEIIGKPKENVDKGLKLIVENLKAMKDVRIVDEKYFDAEPKESLWSNFIELEILTTNIDTFIGVVIDYLPASVEVIEPEDIVLRAHELGGMLNDLSMKMMRINTEYGKTHIERNILRERLSMMVNINILRSIRDKQKTLKELSDDMRITEDDLKPFLDELCNSGKIKSEDDIYSLK